MASADPLEVPSRSHPEAGLFPLLRTYGGAVAWIALLLAVTIGSLASGGASPKAVGLGFLYGCAFGVGLEWFDRAWHRRTGRALRMWARTSREQAHVAVPFLIMLVTLSLLTLQTQAHEGLTATLTFTGCYLIVTMPRHQRRP